MTTIRIEGVDELIKRLDTIEKMERVKAAIKNASIELKGYMAEYPAESHRPNPLIKLDPKVRRGFFYHLKHGDIEVPYRRGQSPGSKKLGQSWTVSTENNGWRGIIGTAVSYARLVQDSENQTSYHRHTGWLTTNQAILLHGNAAIDTIRNAIQQEVNNG